MDSCTYTLFSISTAVSTIRSNDKVVFTPHSSLSLHLGEKRLFLSLALFHYATAGLRPCLKQTGRASYKLAPTIWMYSCTYTLFSISTAVSTIRSNDKAVFTPHSNRSLHLGEKRLFLNLALFYYTTVERRPCLKRTGRASYKLAPPIWMDSCTYTLFSISTAVSTIRRNDNDGYWSRILASTTYKTSKGT
jgi:hypothetical protein